MSYLRNRLIQAVITIYSVITIGFFFIRMMPGGPVDYLLSQIQQNPQEYGLPPNPRLEQINEVLTEQLIVPPDRPMHEAYIYYMRSFLLEGDMGVSLIVSAGTDVVPLMMRYIPWSIFLSSLGLVYSIVASIILGTLMAYYEGGKFDAGLTTSMIFASAFPYYAVAILTLYFFSWNLEWFPPGGHYGPNVTPGMNIPFIVNLFWHAALPVLSGIMVGFGANALAMRANSIRILGDDYLRVGRLRGLSTYTLTTRYLGRNAILPMYTGIILGLAGLISSSVIVETIFNYQGLGQLMFDAAQARDYPLLTANLIVVTIIYVIATLIADFTYALVDPRAEQSSMG